MQKDINGTSIYNFLLLTKWISTLIFFSDLALTTHRLDQTHTDVEHVKNELKGKIFIFIFPSR